MHKRSNNVGLPTSPVIWFLSSGVDKLIRSLSPILMKNTSSAVFSQQDGSLLVNAVDGLTHSETSRMMEVDKITSNHEPLSHKPNGFCTFQELPYTMNLLYHMLQKFTNGMIYRYVALGEMGVMAWR